MPQTTGTRKGIGSADWSVTLRHFMQNRRVTTAWLRARYRYVVIRGWLIERLHSRKELHPVSRAKGTDSRL